VSTISHKYIKERWQSGNAAAWKAVRRLISVSRVRIPVSPPKKPKWRIFQMGFLRKIANAFAEVILYFPTKIARKNIKHYTENYEQYDLPSKNRWKRVPIVVLGGHSSRAFTAVKLAKQIGSEIVIASGVEDGFYEHLKNNLPRETELIREANSTNTRTNAYYSKKVIDEKTGSHAAIVLTDVWHLYRATRLFSKVGLRVMPYAHYREDNLEARYDSESRSFVRNMISIKFGRWT
jgi:hypothetical protein